MLVSGAARGLIFNEAPLPRIEIVKSAFPTEYAVPGEQITCTYTVVNTGNRTLHDIRPPTGPPVSYRDQAIIVALPVVPVTG
jgi:hypothetical protein